MSEQETGPTEAPRHRPEHSEGSWLPLPLGDGRAGTCYSKLVAMMKEEASPATLKHVTLLINIGFKILTAAVIFLGITLWSLLKVN
jgi:hypothetical protein